MSEEVDHNRIVGRRDFQLFTRKVLRLKRNSVIFEKIEDIADRCPFSASNIDKRNFRAGEEF